MSVVTAVAVTAVVGGLVYSGVQASKAAKTGDDANVLARDNMNIQNAITQKQLAWQMEQQKKLDAQKEIYANYEFTNPYANIENVFEDLTVNKQQAEFQRQMFQQSQADIMQALRDTAGASGVASLAQALAGQGQLASQRAAISIGQQEQAIAMQERQQAAAIDMAERGGEAQLQQQEMSRQATLLGVEMGSMAGANAAVQQAYANQMAAGSAQVAAMSAQAAAQYGLAGQALSGSLSLAGAAAGGMGGGGAPTKTGTSCFIENSKVLMKDGTFKNIQDIKAGNIVQSTDGESVVKRLITHEVNDVCRIYTNGFVNTTAEHPLYINDKWTNAEKLNWDNELTYVDKLYNVETDNTFIVDNVIASGVLSLEFKQI